MPTVCGNCKEYEAHIKYLESKIEKYQGAAMKKLNLRIKLWCTAFMSVLTVPTVASLCYWAYVANTGLRFIWWFFGALSFSVVLVLANVVSWCIVADNLAKERK